MAEIKKCTLVYLGEDVDINDILLARIGSEYLRCVGHAVLNGAIGRCGLGDSEDEKREWGFGDLENGNQEWEEYLSWCQRRTVAVVIW